MYTLDEFKVYQLAMNIGEKIWKVVNTWDFFQKDTVGKQLVRAVDSIGANLSEGFGRYHYKENKNFCYYSRGSLFETKTWLKKANNRRLINNDEYESLEQELDIISLALNTYIKSIGNMINSEKKD